MEEEELEVPISNTPVLTPRSGGIRVDDKGDDVSPPESEFGSSCETDSGNQRLLDPLPHLPPWGELEEEEEREFYIRVLTPPPWVESLGQHSKSRDLRVKGHLCLVCTC